MINKIAVESSNIASIGYSEEENTCEVSFKNGSTYRAKGLDKAAYDEFLSSKSKGSHFATKLRNNYKWEKI
jgi:hypothetical protein